MKRKLFCEISPTCYKISVEKERLKRNIKNTLNKNKLATEHKKEELPVIVKGHTSIILRKLHNVDMQLQINKKTNLIIAAKKINGLIHIILKVIIIKAIKIRQKKYKLNQRKILL